MEIYKQQLAWNIEMNIEKQPYYGVRYTEQNTNSQQQINTASRSLIQPQNPRIQPEARQKLPSFKEFLSMSSGNSPTESNNTLRPLRPQLPSSHIRSMDFARYQQRTQQGAQSHYNREQTIRNARAMAQENIQRQTLSTSTNSAFVPYVPQGSVGAFNHFPSSSTSADQAAPRYVHSLTDKVSSVVQTIRTDSNAQLQRGVSSQTSNSIPQITRENPLAIQNHPRERQEYRQNLNVLRKDEYRKNVLEPYFKSLEVVSLSKIYLIDTSSIMQSTAHNLKDMLEEERIDSLIRIPISSVQANSATVKKISYLDFLNYKIQCLTHLRNFLQENQGLNHDSIYRDEICNSSNHLRSILNHYAANGSCSKISQLDLLKLAVSDLLEAIDSSNYEKILISAAFISSCMKSSQLKNRFHFVCAESFDRDFKLSEAEKHAVLKRLQAIIPSVLRATQGTGGLTDIHDRESLIKHMAHKGLLPFFSFLQDYMIPSYIKMPDLIRDVHHIENIVAALGNMKKLIINQNCSMSILNGFASIELMVNMASSNEMYYNALRSGLQKTQNADAVLNDFDNAVQICADNLRSAEQTQDETTVAKMQMITSAFNIIQALRNVLSTPQTH